MDMAGLAADIKTWGREIGFEAVGIARATLGPEERRLARWLADGWHGEMRYMVRRATARARPGKLVPGTLTVVSVRLACRPPEVRDPRALLDHPEIGYVARYALGRDYHRVLRPRLQKLADRIEHAIGPFGYRAFVDSAPVMEKPLARNAGLGFLGKHTNLIAEGGGSWFVLGELYTDLPLPVDPGPPPDRCGRCRACLDVCPTGAIVAPYRLDARRCISYLTIELHGPIPVELRRAVGNRIFGCDDCQLVCPWNRFARVSDLPDFAPRHGLDAPRLVDLFAWTEQEFLSRTEGSALRRLGYERWLRNLAVALGNAATSAEVLAALEARRDHPSPLVREHVAWALAEQSSPSGEVEPADCD